MICFKCGKLVFEEECVTHCNTCHIEDMKELEDVTELRKRLNQAEITLLLFVALEYTGYKTYGNTPFCEECGTSWEYSVKGGAIQIEKVWHIARCKIAVGKQFLGLPVNIKE